MSYATLDDLIARAGVEEILDVADRDGDGTPDPDVVLAALAAADEAVNTYLAGRYVLPLSSVPSPVRTWAVAIARYRLHLHAPPDYVVRDYKDALSELRLAASGTIALVGAAGVVPATAPGGIDADGVGPVFDRCGLRGWL